MGLAKGTTGFDLGLMRLSFYPDTTEVQHGWWSGWMCVQGQLF